MRCVPLIIALALSMALMSGPGRSAFQHVNDPNLVKLNLLVVDSSHNPVNDIKQEELSVFENEVPKTISFFSNREVSLIYGIAIDNSASFKDVLSGAVESARIILSGNKADDETLVVRFIDNKKIETVQDFTSNKASLFAALDKLYVEGGETAVIDAVYLTAQHISAYKKGDHENHRALVLITDGEDRSSYYSQEKLIDFLRKENIQVFIISVLSVLSERNTVNLRSPRDRAKSLMSSIAKETGGLVFDARSRSELQAAANSIARCLRNQYVIGYVSNSNKDQKGFRKVKIKLSDSPERKNHTVVVRSGYVMSRN